MTVRCKNYTVAHSVKHADQYDDDEADHDSADVHAHEDAVGAAALATVGAGSVVFGRSAVLARLNETMFALGSRNALARQHRGDGDDDDEEHVIDAEQQHAAVGARQSWQRQLIENEQHEEAAEADHVATL